MLEMNTVPVVFLQPCSLFSLQAAKLELVSIFRCFVQCVLANAVEIVFLRREEKAVQYISMFGCVVRRILQVAVF